MTDLSHYLRPALAPESVAVVGASDRPGSLGAAVWTNLLAGGFRGTLHPVNPKHTRLGDQACYPSLHALPSAPDLVVVTIRAAKVPDLVEAAGRARARAVLVLSNGFADAGSGGRALQLKALAAARRHGIRLFGPNALGVMRPSIGLNASFARTAARPGSVALVSQSGAVVAALLDHAWSAGFGFSSVIATGAGSEIEFAQVLDYLAIDQQTRSVIVYVEGVRDARAFVSAIRAASSIKPVVVLKAGRHEEAARIVANHVGATVGDDAVFDAGLRRAGAIRVFAYGELLAAAETLASGRVPAGNRLAIVTNGIGLGVLAADALAEHEVTLASLADRRNPVDLGGDVDAGHLASAVHAVLEDRNHDGVLVLFRPTMALGAEAAARQLLPVIAATRKPVVTAWLGEADAGIGRALCKEARVPALATPEQGVAAFGYLARYQRGRQVRLQVPPPRVDEIAIDLGPVRVLLAAVRGDGRSVLAGDDCRRLLALCGIAFAGEDGAARAARAEVRTLAVGLRRDPIFGPAIRFGLGGLSGEVVGDVALALPPLNRVLARGLIDRTRVARMLGRFHGLPPIDEERLIDVLLRLSELACELPCLRTLEIDPLLADPAGVLALEARVVVDDAPLQPDPVYSHLAIHPYPRKLVRRLQLRDGRELLLRPVRPEDVEADQRLVARLSPQSLYHRFHAPIRELSLERLARFFQIDYDREMALVAIEVAGGVDEIRGIVRYARNPDGESAEFGLVVDDAWQKHGLGSALMEAIEACARVSGVSEMIGFVLHDNRVMAGMLAARGYQPRRAYSDDPGVTAFVKPLRGQV